MEMPCKDFLQEVASASPAPGGGSVSALAGALGGALAAMVANLTLGKEQFAALAADMQEALEQACYLQKQLQQKAEEDTEAFHRVMAAIRLPKETEKEKEGRRQALQTAMLDAARIPMEVAEASLKVLELCSYMAARGNPRALSDAGVGGLLAAAAVQGALFNVEINLPSIRDREFAAVMRHKAGELEMQACRLQADLISRVKAGLQAE